MVNIPNVPIEELRKWIRLNHAGEVIDRFPASVYGLAKKYNIATWQIDGQTFYYLPDCERVRDILAKERAEKVARAEASQ